MNFLFLTHRVPFPPNRGDRIRSYHILRFLSERAEIDLACLSSEPVADASRRELVGRCRRVAIIQQNRLGRWVSAATTFAANRSATEGLFASRALEQVLHHWSEDTRYDAVVAYCSSMGQYLSVGRLRESPCIVDFVDIDSQKWFDYADRARMPMRWLYRHEGRRVRRLEGELIERARAVTVVSSAEADILRKCYPHAPVHVVSNGVDVTHFEQAPDNVIANSCGTLASGQAECVFVGALDYLPNVDGITWFAREVWPDVRTQFPSAKLVVVGRRPVSAVHKLARRPGIEVVGEVPDVRPYLHRSRLVVVPLRLARGIQNKVLEAMAAGKPVIASPQALEGLCVVPAKHVYRAATPAQWSSLIGTLLTDDVERQRLAAAGQALVRHHHRWENCLQPLEGRLQVPRESTGVIGCSLEEQTLSSYGSER
jgi:sugar transferase (PEP-CTERM/EpsH1 system associated)